MEPDSEAPLQAEASADPESSDGHAYDLIPERPFHTTSQVCDVLQLTQRHVYRLLKSGDLVGHQFGTAWRISHDDLLMFIVERRRNKKLE